MSSDDNVVALPGVEWGKLSVQPRDRVIEPGAVAKGMLDRADELEMLVCVGIDKEGRLHAASTQPHVADTLLLIERFKRKLLLPFGDDEFAA